MTIGYILRLIHALAHLLKGNAEFRAAYEVPPPTTSFNYFDRQLEVAELPGQGFLSNRRLLQVWFISLHKIAANLGVVDPT